MNICHIKIKLANPTSVSFYTTLESIFEAKVGVNVSEGCDNGCCGRVTWRPRGHEEERGFRRIKRGENPGKFVVRPTSANPHSLYQPIAYFLQLCRSFTCSLGALPESWTVPVGTVAEELSAAAGCAKASVAQTGVKSAPSLKGHNSWEPGHRTEHH